MQTYINQFNSISKEEKQAFLRFLYTMFYSLYFIVVSHILKFQYNPMGLYFCFFTIAFTFLVFIFVVQYAHFRIMIRKIMLVYDIFTVTVCLAIFDYLGYPLLFFYLYVSIGAGVRYGNQYLYSAIIMGLISFFIVCEFSNYWGNSGFQILGVTLLITIIPMYIAILNNRLQVALAQANSANAEKDRFIATMSHELRTPLTGVITASHLIEKQSLSQDNKQLLGTIKNSSNELLTLINQVLDFTKSESDIDDKGNTNFFPFILIRDCLSILVPDAQQKDIQLNFLLCKGFTKAVSCNEQKLRQVLINIIGNSVKFTESGGVSVLLDIQETSADQTQLRIEITDTGIGINEDQLETVFEPFKQADEGITRQFGGSGLGTTISNQLVKEMSGELTLSSEVNVGTSATIIIPVDEPELSINNQVTHITLAFSNFDNIPVKLLRATEETGCTVLNTGNEEAHYLLLPSEQDDAVIVQNQQNLQSHILVNPTKERLTSLLSLLTHEQQLLETDQTQPEIPSSIINKNVLIVDDNLTNRTIIQMILKEIGMQTTTANDGVEALALIKSNTYDLFIFDRHMPGMSGNELLNETRNLVEKHIPAILLTADISEDAHDKAKESGFDDLIHKPFEPEVLTKLVINILE